MISLLLNADEFLAAGRIAELKAAMGEPEFAGLNTVELVGTQTDPASVFSEANAMPFLASRRLVIVYGMLDHLEKRMAASKSTGSAAHADAARLLAGLSIVPESCDLLLVDNSVDKHRALWKGFTIEGADGQPDREVAGLEALVKAGTVQLEKLKAPDGKALPAWLQARARSKGIAIDGGAVALLAENVGPNLRQLDNELEKLSLYALGRSITVQDVREIVTDASEEKIWNLTDGLCQRNAGKAMRALHDLRRMDEAPLRLLASIANQYRMLIEVKTLMASGQRNKDAIAKQLGYKPFPVQKAMGLVNSFSFDELAAIMERLLEADMAMKTGVDQQCELDMVVADLTLQPEHRSASTRTR